MINGGLLILVFNKSWSLIWFAHVCTLSPIGSTYQVYHVPSLCWYLYFYIFNILYILPSKGLLRGYMILTYPLMVDVHLSFWKEQDQKKAGFPLHFQAPWRESLDVRFRSLHRSRCTMHWMQEKIWRCFSNPMSRCKNATQSHAARGNWPRCKLFATVHLLVASTYLGGSKLLLWSFTPNQNATFADERTELNRQHWSNPWSQIGIVLNLYF